MENILVTGGAGYVGAELVPALLAKGHKVRVLDLFIYGGDVFDGIPDRRHLECVKGDLRDPGVVSRSLNGVHIVIHLACISNDPSFELDPELGRSINYDAFRPLVEASIKGGVSRFIFASSSSVYGVKEEENVTEDMSLESLTDYSKYKALCEKVLLEYQSPRFTTCILRPATVCGYSPRLRLDVVVNMLTAQAYFTRQVKILGGEQKRPNVHIKDMVRAYLHVLEQPDHKIAGKIFNVGYENHRVRELAAMIKEVVGPQVTVTTAPTNDNRSYHISSQKIRDELGFSPTHTIKEAVQDLKDAFDRGEMKDAFTNNRYRNIETMKAIQLK